MKLHSRLGHVALYFSVISLLTIPLYAQEEIISSNERNERSGGGWGWNSISTYLGTVGNTPEQNLKIPVLMGVEVKNLWDSWGDARNNGRSHEGVDIIAPRGTPVVSPTKAVVASIGYGANGGNYVYTINPGGERFYFAHLDGYAPGIVSGKVLEAGDLIGYVGNSGNASGGSPHLHLGIYSNGAQNPFPRLTLAFTDAERVSALNKMVTSASDQHAEAKNIVAKYKSFLTGAQTKGLPIGDAIITALGGSTVATVTIQSNGTVTTQTLSRDLKLGIVGEDVRTLQKFLNTHGAVVASSGAGALGNETTYFGPATKAALARYQASKGITPTSGYFGPLTRAVVAKDQLLAVANN